MGLEINHAIDQWTLRLAVMYVANAGESPGN